MSFLKIKVLQRIPTAYLPVLAHIFFYSISHSKFPKTISTFLDIAQVPIAKHHMLLIMTLYMGTDESLAWPGRKQFNVSIRMAWISFGVLLCRKRNLMRVRVSILLKSRASLKCFRVYFLPGRVKDLSASRYFSVSMSKVRLNVS